MRVIISGGGTGGHIYPALAIAEGLKSQGEEILYIGGLGSAEEKLIPNRGITFFGISTAPLHRRSPRVVADLYANWQGMRQAKKLIADFAPDIVIGTGGFVTAPVLLAAQKLRIPTVLHEQNAYPGLANRLLAKKAAAVCLNFIAAASLFPTDRAIYHVGLPVRQQIMNIGNDSVRKEAYQFFAITGEQSKIPTLLITGGSQGAKSINNAAVKAYRDLLSQGIRIIHLCGRKNYFEIKQMAPDDPRLILLPYLDKMEYALAIADLALARAGASFLAEAAVLGLPTILVPYPYATDDHQKANADSFEQALAAVVIQELDLNKEHLTKTVASLLSSPKKLAQMKEGALTMAKITSLDDIMQVVYDIAQNNDPTR